MRRARLERQTSNMSTKQLLHDVRIHQNFNAHITVSLERQHHKNRPSENEPREEEKRIDNQTSGK